jgi:hypothetical protein
MWASRNGEKVPFGVRRNPDRTIAETEWVKARLLSGLNPYRAIQVDDFPGELAAGGLPGGPRTARG